MWPLRAAIDGATAPDLRLSEHRSCANQRHGSFTFSGRRVHSARPRRRDTILFITYSIERAMHPLHERHCPENGDFSQMRMSEMRDKMNTELAGNPFRGLAEGMAQAVQIQWGFGVLLVGAVLVLLAAAKKDEAAIASSSPIS